MQQDNEEWISRYKDLVENKRMRLLSMSQDERDQMRGRWAELLAEVRAALNDDPAGPRAQAVVARWVEFGAAMADPDDEALADHFKARPQTLDVSKELSKELSEDEMAKLSRAREQFSDPRLRDWLRKAFAARTAG